MALIPVRSEADCLTSNHTKQSLRPQPSLGAQIEALPLPRERFSPLAELRLLAGPTEALLSTQSGRSAVTALGRGRFKSAPFGSMKAA